MVSLTQRHENALRSYAKPTELSNKPNSILMKSFQPQNHNNDIIDDCLQCMPTEWNQHQFTLLITIHANDWYASIQTYQPSFHFTYSGVRTYRKPSAQIASVPPVMFADRIFWLVRSTRFTPHNRYFRCKCLKFNV